jgi:hypothetical protein
LKKIVWSLDTERIECIIQVSARGAGERSPTMTPMHFLTRTTYAPGLPAIPAGTEVEVLGRAPGGLRVLVYIPGVSGPNGTLVVVPADHVEAQPSPAEECPQCEGSGRVSYWGDHGEFVFEEPCDRCMGWGQVHAHPERASVEADPAYVAWTSARDAEDLAAQMADDLPF